MSQADFLSILLAAADGSSDHRRMFIAFAVVAILAVVVGHDVVELVISRKSLRRPSSLVR